MSRATYIWVREAMDWVPANQFKRPAPKGPMIVRDIEPYRSVVDGSIVTSRSHHRAHLRQHGVVEIGNERIEPKRQELDPVGPDIKRAIEELGG